MTRKELIIDIVGALAIGGLFIWGFMTGPDGWGWQLFAKLAGIE
jgi:hypothetical protein